MRNVWALVPARSFVTGKSRFAELGAVRAELAHTLFAHVCAVLRASPEIGDVLVATDGDDVARAAAAQGAHVLRDLPGSSRPSLASIIDRGLTTIAERGGHAAIVVMADLPLCERDDVTRLALALEEADVVAAPDRDQLGTNALALRVPARFGTCFGNPDSYLRHVATARALGLGLATIDRDGLAFDLDSPADLDDLMTARTIPRRIERLSVLRQGVDDAQQAIERGTLRRHAARVARSSA